MRTNLSIGPSIIRVKHFRSWMRESRKAEAVAEAATDTAGEMEGGTETGMETDTEEETDAAETEAEMEAAETMDMDLLHWQKVVTMVQV